MLKKLSRDEPGKCLDFGKMEDDFLGNEFKVMCSFHKEQKCPSFAQNYANNMKRIDREMNNIFGSNYLEHHEMHIKTTKTCGGGAPSTKMTHKSMGC